MTKPNLRIVKTNTEHFQCPNCKGHDFVIVGQLGKACFNCHQYVPSELVRDIQSKRENL